jgi:hypothetical protein
MDFLYVSDLVKYVNTLGNLARQLERELASANARAEAAEERETMRLAGISTAAFGYWKEGDSIHPDYDTVALRDVAKLYQKYVAAKFRLREVAVLIRGMSCPFPFSNNKDGDVGFCLDNEQCGCEIKIKLRSLDLDKIVAPAHPDEPLVIPDFLRKFPDAAPQISTAAVNSAPSHEGVGQGAPASATPIKDEP